MALYEAIVSGLQPVHVSNGLAISVGRPAPWIFLSCVKGHLDAEGAKLIGHAIQMQAASEHRKLVICHDWSNMTDYDGDARVRLLDTARAVLPRSRAIHIFTSSTNVSFGLRAARLIVAEITAHAEMTTFVAAVTEALAYSER